MLPALKNYTSAWLFVILYLGCDGFLDGTLSKFLARLFFLYGRFNDIAGVIIPSLSLIYGCISTHPAIDSCMYSTNAPLNLNEVTWNQTCAGEQTHLPTSF